jgi:tubulin polyglutamylase TTLL9
MLDENLRPWLIEVNASPSMSVDSASDRALKTALFEDVLNVVDMEKQFDRTSDTAKRVGGFDLIHDGVVVEENLRLLGALNDDRESSLARTQMVYNEKMAM